LLVKADDVARARMKLAAAGVTPSDANIGFEILDKDQGLGTSQFMEATRYRRGLEGELARTISSAEQRQGCPRAPGHSEKLGVCARRAQAKCFGLG